MAQQDMTPQDMTPQDMNQLANDIDSYTYNTRDTVTPGELHVKLWPCLDRLRNDPNKNNLLESWKYKNQFISAEASHANGVQLCENVSWEQSFVLNLWMCIHH